MRALGKAVLTLFAVIGMIATIQELRGQEKAVLDGAVFRHVGVVVKNLDAAVKMYADVFGVTPVRTVDITATYPPHFTGNAKARLKIAQLQVGSVLIEVIEPVDGPATHYDDLQKFGPFVQHLAFAIPNVAQARQALLAKGGKWTLGHEGHVSAYVDMKDSLGFSLELNTLKQ